MTTTAEDPAVQPLSAPAQAASLTRREDLVREAEAQRALAELFPHLKLDALRAIQDLFPLQAQHQQAAAGRAELRFH